MLHHSSIIHLFSRIGLSVGDCFICRKYLVNLHSQTLLECVCYSTDSGQNVCCGIRQMPQRKNSHCRKARPEAMRLVPISAVIG